MTPEEDKDDVPARIDSHEALDDGVTPQEFKRATIEATVRLEPISGEWELPLKPEPLPAITCNPWMRDCFATPEIAEWLKNRMAHRTDDITEMNMLAAAGDWSDKAEAERAAGIQTRERGTHRRIRNGLARDVIHTHRLRGLIAGETPKQTERDMIGKVLGESDDAELPTPLEILELKERARESARQNAKLQALHAEGIFPSAAGNITDENAAKYLSTTPRELRRLRKANKGPTYIQQGTRIWYAMEDLDAYLQSVRVQPMAR